METTDTREVASTDPSSLTEDEAYAVGGLLFMMFRGYETSFFHHRERLLTDDVFRGISKSVEDWVATPLFPIWWAARRANFSTAFASYVDGLGNRLRTEGTSRSGPPAA